MIPCRSPGEAIGRMVFFGPSRRLEGLVGGGDDRQLGKAYSPGRGVRLPSGTDGFRAWIYELLEKGLARQVGSGSFSHRIPSFSNLAGVVVKMKATQTLYRNKRYGWLFRSDWS